MRSGLGPAPEPGRRRRLDHALRRDGAQRFHEIVDVGVERREMAAAARRDPAAERRILEALRKMAQREPVRLAAAPRAPGRRCRPRSARRARSCRPPSPCPCSRRSIVTAPLWRARAAARRRRTTLDPPPNGVTRRVARRRPSRARPRRPLRCADRRRRPARWRSRAQGRARARDRTCRRCARRGRSARWCRTAAKRARVTRGAVERDVVEPRRACALALSAVPNRASRAREHEGLFVGGQALALAAPAEMLQPRLRHCFSSRFLWLYSAT